MDGTARPPDRLEPAAWAWWYVAAGRTAGGSWLARRSRTTTMVRGDFGSTGGRRTSGGSAR